MSISKLTFPKALKNNKSGGSKKIKIMNTNIENLGFEVVDLSELKGGFNEAAQISGSGCVNKNGYCTGPNSGCGWEQGHCSNKAAEEAVQ